MDVTGLPAAASAAPAGTDDELVAANPLGSRIEILVVDRGVKAVTQRRLATDRGIEVKVVRWDEPQLDEHGKKVFRPIPYAWRVEVAHALIGRNRRRAKSFENTVNQQSRGFR